MPEATLYEAMVSPFANKNVLGASVGIKEDTSDRKFKDVKLAEFFGIRRGRSAAAKTERLKQKDNTAEVTSENLLHLSKTGISSNWLFPRESAATPFTAESPKLSAPEEDITKDIYSIQNYGRASKLCRSGFYFIITCLFVALILAKQIEKTYFIPTTS